MWPLFWAVLLLGALYAAGGGRQRAAAAPRRGLRAKPQESQPKSPELCSAPSAQMAAPSSVAVLWVDKRHARESVCSAGP